MVRWMTLLLAVAVLGTTARPAAAAEADARKLLGTWTHKARDSEVTIVVEPDTLRCSMAFKEGYTFSLVADYVVTEDGILLGILRGKGGEKHELEKRLFGCRFKLHKDALVLSEVTCHDEVRERVRELVSGKYQRVAGAPVSSLSQSGKDRSGKKQPDVSSSDLGQAVRALLKMNSADDLWRIDYEWERI